MELTAIADFLFEVGMLKRTPRSGFQFLGTGAETVAEHSLRVAVIGYVLAKMSGKFAPEKIVLMCLFHDLVEARTGDLNYVNKRYVKADEDLQINRGADAHRIQAAGILRARRKTAPIEVARCEEAARSGAH